MELWDADNEGADNSAPENVQSEVDETYERPVAETPDAGQSPEEFVETVADLLERDVESAGDAVGDLLAIAHEEGAVRVAAGEALDAIGRHNPGAFEVWTDALADAATDPDDEVAFFALRAFAQLGAVDPSAAGKGLTAALGNVGAPSADLRQAALSVIAEVGPTDPDAVRRADRPVTVALADEHPGVRTGAAIAAGRLLAAAPSHFPRTATALMGALDDEDDRVRKYAHLSLANFASEHPSNVPRKEGAIAALANVSDDELGLRRGATGEALSALVSLTFEEDAATG